MNLYELLYALNIKITGDQMISGILANDTINLLAKGGYGKMVETTKTEANLYDNIGTFYHNKWVKFESIVK